MSIRYTLRHNIPSAKLAEEDVKLNLEEDERSLREFAREKQREEQRTKQYVKPKKEYQR